MKTLKWKAYLRLTGETPAVCETEILDQFDKLAQSFQRVGVDYNAVVLVQGRPNARPHGSRQQPTPSQPVRAREPAERW